MKSEAGWHFSRFVVSDEERLLKGKRQAIIDAEAAEMRRLKDVGADLNTVVIELSYLALDSIGFSVRYRLFPTPVAIPEWVPTDLDRMRGAA